MSIEMPKFTNPKEAYAFAFRNQGRMTPEQLDFCRQLCLGNRELAYWYASDVDNSPRDDTRQACLGSPEWAYWYASDVDKSPRDDTRQASLGSPAWAYQYACDVDKSPRDDTRQACLENPKWAYQYARGVDKSPREDTRQACLGSPKLAYRYASEVDNCFHEQTYEAVKRTSYQKQYESTFKEDFITEKNHRIVLLNPKGDQETLICCWNHWSQELSPYYTGELGFVVAVMAETTETCQFCKKG